VEFDAWVFSHAETVSESFSVIWTAEEVNYYAVVYTAGGDLGGAANATVY